MNIGEVAGSFEKENKSLPLPMPEKSIFSPLQGTNISLVLYGLLLFPGFSDEH